jgi:hypothetical protein
MPVASLYTIYVIPAPKTEVFSEKKRPIATFYTKRAFTRLEIYKIYKNKYMYCQTLYVSAHQGFYKY